MDETDLELEIEFEEYLSNPYRVSVLTKCVYMRPAIEQLVRVGLQVDYRLSCVMDLEYHSRAIVRDGLGVLAVIGRAERDDFDHTDQTRHVPHILSRLGAGETPTVHIPLELDQVLAPRSIDEDGYTFTRTLELTDSIRFNPRRILEEGALLVKSLVEAPYEVI